MTLSCRIKKGQIFAPNNKPSILYKSLEDLYGKEEALKRYALTETEDYKDSVSKKVDSNGEMTLESFNKFSLEAEQQNFSQEILDLQLRIGSVGINTLKNNLFIEGIPIINETTLESTGIFTQDEIQYIINNENVINNLEIFISNETSTNTEVLDNNYLVLSNNYNSIGIKPYLNPSEVKEEVLKVLSKATNPSEVSELIDTIEYPSIIENYRNTLPTMSTQRLVKTNCNVGSIDSPAIGFYPNPLLTSIGGDLHITLENESAKMLSIQITDITGRVILKQENELHRGFNQIDMNVSDLTVGSYLIVTSADGAAPKADRFIVQK